MLRQQVYDLEQKAMLKQQRTSTTCIETESNVTRMVKNYENLIQMKTFLLERNAKLKEALERRRAESESLMLQMVIL